MTTFKEKRMEICNKCPSMLLGVCRKCGCFVKIKTMIKLAECPINKWGKEK